MISEIRQKECDNIHGGFNPGGVVGIALGGALAEGLSHEPYNGNRIYMLRQRIKVTVNAMLLYTGVHIVAMTAANLVSGIIINIKDRIINK